MLSEASRSSTFRVLHARNEILRRSAPQNDDGEEPVTSSEPFDVEYLEPRPMLPEGRVEGLRTNSLRNPQVPSSDDSFYYTGIFLVHRNPPANKLTGSVH